MRRRWRAVRSTSPILLAVTPLVLAGCGVDVARARQGGDDSYPPPSLAVAAFQPAAPAAQESSPVESLTFDGDDFTLRYPGDASVRPIEGDPVPGAANALEIRGPALRDVAGDPIEGSATYSFEIVSYANPDRLTLDAWLARHREQENEGDALRAASSSGETAEAPTSASVGGLPALRESRFGGDCRLVRYYVARGTRVVALRYADFPVESDSLNPENLRTYRKVIDSFRWKGT